MYRISFLRKVDADAKEKKCACFRRSECTSARTPAEVVVVFFNKCDEMTITNSIKLASQIDFGEHKKNFSK